jgi:hypothetical protein
MQDFEIAAMRTAWANASWQEIRDMRDRYARSKSASAKESAELMQQILEERLAEEDEPTPAAWSKANPEKPKPLTPAEERRKEELRMERETQGGRFLPKPKAPESPYRNQLEYNQHQALMTPAVPPISPYACLECTRFKKAASCCGACESPTFWQARRMTLAEYKAFLASQKPPRD